MDFGETLLAAQKNQQQKSSDNVYYRAKFEPPKREHKPAAKLSANIQKFLAKKEEEERRKQEEVKRKRDELLAMRDPKANRKIQKMLKVIKSANKSVLEEATDHEHTAVTRGGAEQPDQDDYGYESQEAAAFYSKMMEKYSKIPDEEKFPAAKGKPMRKDLEGTRERMRAAIQRGEEPQPRQRKSRTHQAPEKQESPPPPPVPEKKTEKPKIRRAMPPPIDFNQLLKLAEQKKDEPVAAAAPARRQAEPEPERPMTKRERMEFEQEQARREAKRRRMMEADGRGSAGIKQQQRMETENKPESAFTRIPKIGDKNSSLNKSNSGHVKQPIKDHPRKMEREKIFSTNMKQEMPKYEQKKNIDMKSQNTYRIEKGFHDKRTEKYDRDEDKAKANRESEGNRPSRPEDRGRSNREDERGRSNRSEDQFKVNRADERTQANKFEYRNRPSLQGNKGQNNRLEDRNKNNREEERDRTNNPEERSRPNVQHIRNPAIRPEDQKVNRIDDRGRSNRPDDRSRTNHEDERLHNNRQVDQSRANRENQRLSQTNRPQDRYRANQEDGRARATNRPDEGNRMNQRIEKGQNSREQEKAKSTDRVKLSRPEDRLKKENINANGHMTSHQNKLPQKSSSQQQFRKPELKEKLMAKERALFGAERGSPKQNSNGPDIIKPTKSNEHRPKEAPSKLLKQGPTDRRMVPNNNSSKPNQSVGKPATFDFDKHVSSMKKSALERGYGPSRKNLSGEQRNRNQPPKRRMVNSDSEYDSELDDFIDDGENEDDTDYSRQIQKIFGYDKSRYQDMDDDDVAMESSFAQQMKEEYHSKKIGMMEDLEDMRLEALEKKKSKKRRRISDDD